MLDRLCHWHQRIYVSGRLHFEMRSIIPEQKEEEEEEARRTVHLLLCSFCSFPFFGSLESKSVSLLQKWRVNEKESELYQPVGGPSSRPSRQDWGRKVPNFTIHITLSGPMLLLLLLVATRSRPSDSQPGPSNSFSCRVQLLSQSTLEKMECAATYIYYRLFLVATPGMILLCLRSTLDTLCPDIEFKVNEYHNMRFLTRLTRLDQEQQLLKKHVV